jgi:hypothetical protein
MRRFSPVVWAFVAIVAIPAGVQAQHRCEFHAVDSWTQDEYDATRPLEWSSVSYPTTLTLSMTTQIEEADASPVSVPEPAAGLLLLTGLVGMAGTVVRRRGSH